MFTSVRPFAVMASLIRFTVIASYLKSRRRESGAAHSARFPLEIVAKTRMVPVMRYTQLGWAVLGCIAALQVGRAAEAKSTAQPN